MWIPLGIISIKLKVIMQLSGQLEQFAKVIHECENDFA